jgi:sporulation protein YlmC with PRC-barrel domain
MLKTLMISAAVSALLVSGALAQSNPPANSPAANSHVTETKSPKFIQAQGTDKWVFSRFKGTDVLGPDNTKVGSVTDMLFDKNGKIDGLIVGVGGFLGIGEKNVAIDMSAFEVQPYRAATSSTTGNANSAMPSDNDPCQSEGVVDQGRAEGGSGLPILSCPRTHIGAARRLSDDWDGAATRRTGSDNAASVGALK